MLQDEPYILYKNYNKLRLQTIPSLVSKFNKRKFIHFDSGNRKFYNHDLIFF